MLTTPAASSTHQEADQARASAHPVDLLDPDAYAELLEDDDH